MRLGDISHAASIAYSRRRRRRAITILVIVGLLLAAVAAAAIVAFCTPVFKIESVEIEGADHLSDSDLEALVTVPEGATLFNVDEAGIIASLQRDAWVEEVHIERRLPSTLAIVVTERKIAAVVDVTTEQYLSIQPWAIAADRIWLMAIPSQDSDVGQTLSPTIYEDLDAVLHITGVPVGLKPEIGVACTDPNVNNALAIIDGMTTSLADQVKTVDATDAASTLLTLDNGVEIAFGDATDIRDKERVALQIMEEHPGKVAYINVRVVDRPTWRAL